MRVHATQANAAELYYNFVQYKAVLPYYILRQNPIYNLYELHLIMLYLFSMSKNNG